MAETIKNHETDNADNVSIKKAEILSGLFRTKDGLSWNETSELLNDLIKLSEKGAVNGSLPTDEQIEIKFPSEDGQKVFMEANMTYDEVRLANYYRRQGAKWLRDLLRQFMEKEQDDLQTTEFVYEFLYNSECSESAPSTMSIHKTREGAEKAMELHKNEILKEWEKSGEIFPYAKEFPFDFDQWWGVRECVLLP